MLNSAYATHSRKYGVISARKAADHLGLAHNTFFKALAGKVIMAQAIIQGEKKKSYGFETAYLDDIKKVISKNRYSSQEVFDQETISKIQQINKKWSK